jgi:hypothetical protein
VAAGCGTVWTSTGVTRDPTSGTARRGAAAGSTATSGRAAADPIAVGAPNGSARAWTTGPEAVGRDHGPSRTPPVSETRPLMAGGITGSTGTSSGGRAFEGSAPTGGAVMGGAVMDGAVMGGAVMGGAVVGGASCGTAARMPGSLPVGPASGATARATRGSTRVWSSGAGT